MEEEDEEDKPDPYDALGQNKPLDKVGTSTAFAKLFFKRNFPMGLHPAMGAGSAYEQLSTHKDITINPLLLALLRPPIGHFFHQSQAAQRHVDVLLSNSVQRWAWLCWVCGWAWLCRVCGWVQ